MSSDIRKKLGKYYNRIDKLAVKGKDKIFDYYKLVDEFIEKGEFDNFNQTLYYYYEINTSIYNGDLSKLKTKTWDLIIFQTNSSFQKKLKTLYDSKSVYQQGFDIYSDSIQTMGFQTSSPLSVTYSVTTGSTQSVVPFRYNDKIYFTISDDIYHMELFKCDWILIDGIEQPFQKTLELFQRFRVSASYSTYLSEMSTTHGRQFLIRTYSRNENVDLTRLNYKLDVSRNSLLGQVVEIDTFSPQSNYYLQSKELATKMGLGKTFLDVTKTGTYSVLISEHNDSLSEEANLLNRYRIAIDYLLS
jgi:hypothetical protein